MHSPDSAFDHYAHNIGYNALVFSQSKSRTDTYYLVDKRMSEILPFRFYIHSSPNIYYSL